MCAPMLDNDDSGRPPPPPFVFLSPLRRSIFDFVSPNYLGTLKEFQASFGNPIEKEQDQERQAALRRVTKPFLLRRLKTDEDIRGELPSKARKSV